MRKSLIAMATVSTAMIVVLATPAYLCGEGDRAKSREDAKDHGSTRPILGSVSMKDAAIDDTAEILGIRTWSGTFELRREVGGPLLVLDFYREGKHVETHRAFGMLNLATRGDFAIQVVDLDYLPLGDAKPGHWRVFAKLKFDGIKGVTHWDIAKDKLGFGDRGGGQTTDSFGPKAGTSTDAPLFFVLYPKPGARVVADRGISPSELIEQNRDSSLLIVRLVFDAGGAKGNIRGR